MLKALVETGTGVVVIGNVAVLVPAETVTVAGTLAADVGAGEGDDRVTGGSVARQGHRAGGRGPSRHAGRGDHDLGESRRLDRQRAFTVTAL